MSVCSSVTSGAFSVPVQMRESITDNNHFQILSSTPVYTLKAWLLSYVHNKHTNMEWWLFTFA